MTDLFIGMAILAVVSQLVLMATVWSTRNITKREATAVGVVVAFFVSFLFCFHIDVHMTLIWTVPEQPPCTKRCAWSNPPPCPNHRD